MGEYKLMFEGLGKKSNLKIFNPIFQTTLPYLYYHLVLADRMY